ncbi:MAG: penicillin-binding protein [Promicromonosporaceae bacterium]|nr:penicillin-binding protein [Promicromonosporaceae bacterium]
MASNVRRERSKAHRIPFTQLIVMLLAFVLVVGLGGGLAAVLLIPMAVGVNAVGEEVSHFFDDIPTELVQADMSEASYMFAADGTVLAMFFSENRIIKPLSEIALVMQHAAIAIEDQRFYEHGGMDFQGTLRAALRNSSSDGQSGGSGITQQYVKNILIDSANKNGDPFGVLQAREATMSRKIREAKLSIAIAQEMSKDEILEGYLNVAQFGSKVYGVEAAARYYFSTTAKDLTVVQAATIAGITKNPNKFDPTRNPDLARERRDAVLYKMWTLGYIGTAEYDAARVLTVEETLNVTPISVGCHAAEGAAFFCDFVAKTIVNAPEFGETREERGNLLYRGGLRIYTTLNTEYQRAAEIAMARNIPAVNSANLGSSLIALEPGTGKILAMIQSTTYETGPNPEPGFTSVNYGTDFSRGGSRGFQPGSNFKPYVLAQWLREGYTLGTMVSSAGRTWTSGDFRSSCVRSSISPWTPGNAEGVSGGMMTAAEALKRSINTAFVHIESKLDLCGIAATAWDMGYRPSQTHEGDPILYGQGTKEDIFVTPSMVLGIQQASPMAMASGYSTMASGGISCDPIAIERVTLADGVTELEVPSANCAQTLEPEVANTMAYAMRGAFERGGTASLSKVKDCRPAAGKTGTSNRSAQTWFTGYFPNLLASVWVGDVNGNASHLSINFEGRRITPLYGSSLAAPLWKDFMDQIVDGLPIVNFPEPDEFMAGGVQVLLGDGTCNAKQPGDPGTLGAHPGVSPVTGIGEIQAAVGNETAQVAVAAGEAPPPAAAEEPAQEAPETAVTG